MQTRLEAVGYDFYTAENGKVGLEKVDEINPDLILLDVIMPVMNGYEVSYSLKNDPEKCKIPIIIVTASGAKQLEQKCLELGVEEIIHKPYDSKYLIERVAFHIGE